MGFHALRVINEDRVQPGRGFAAHSHRDMEIVSYVLDGALEHRDSRGNHSVVRPGDMQLMRAGTGVTHREYNHSPEDVVHFLQIWILPDRTGLAPAYGQRHFPVAARTDAWKLVASRHGRGDSLQIQQDVDIYTAVLSVGAKIVHALAPDRLAWVQVLRGNATLNAIAICEGDGAAVDEEFRLEVASEGGAEMLLFDLAGDAR